MKKSKRNCKKGYSCGRSCISVKFICRTDGLKGQAIKLADNYFQLAKQPEPEPVYLSEGLYGETYLKGDRVVKEYFPEEEEGLFNEFIAANNLINETLVKDGIMPKVHSIGLDKKGKLRSEQEALVGYKTGEKINEEKIIPIGLEPFIEKIGNSLQKHGVIHNDLHLGNIMLKLDEANQVLDAKLIDGDLAVKASEVYGDDYSEEMKSELQILEQDILWILTRPR